MMVKAEWKEYLVQQAGLHPFMKPQDVYKMMYQAAFGAEHLLEDAEAARNFFMEEYNAVPSVDEALYEQISVNMYRVNMKAWKMRELPAEWLFQMFLGSVGKQIPGNEKREQETQNVLCRQLFEHYAEVASEAVKENIFEFSYEEFIQYAEAYWEQGVRPVHHSQSYRDAVRPAYRLVCGEYLRILPILENMAKGKPGHTGPFIIAIDGRCASGKSTMARMLSEITGAGVAHMDDFFLPIELRNAERLSQPGGNVHYERFRQEVLPFLKEKGQFTYRRFDCRKMQPGETRLVAEADYRVIEGAYSHHPIFGEYADLKVFSDVNSQMQIERIGKRDGEDVLTMFQERWIPMEEMYFSAYEIKDKADLVL